MCARTKARLGSSASAYRSATTPPHRRVVAVEEPLAYVSTAGVPVEPGQRRVPVVAGEHLVGALPGLHHADRLADPLAEQVEGDDVVADHRLGHRADRVPERAGQLVGADPDPVVVGAEPLGDRRRSRRTRRPPGRRRTRTRCCRSPARSGPPARAGRRSGWSPGRRRAARPPGCRRPAGAGRRPAAPPRRRPPSRAPTSRSARDGARSAAPSSGARCCEPSGSITRTVAGGSLRTPLRMSAAPGRRRAR